MVLPVPTASVGVQLMTARQLHSVLLKIGLHGSLTWMAPRLLSIQPTMVMAYDSIARKVRRKNIPMTMESLEENIRDIAGVRVVCSFPEDIYELADSFLRQDDITLIEMKDYIKNPKPSGYRSLHLIVQVPIFLQKTKKYVYVEVQLRTIAMDFWASLEHKLRYKKNIPEDEAKLIAQELYDCSVESAKLDERMQKIRSMMNKGESE